MRQMVLVARIIFTRMRIEQVVACRKLKCKTRRAPNVGGVVVWNSEKHLDRAILTRLNVIGEVKMLEKLSVKILSDFFDVFLTSKHALPRSAILTLMLGLLSKLCSTPEYEICLLLSFDSFDGSFCCKLRLNFFEFSKNVNFQPTLLSPLEVVV